MRAIFEAVAAEYAYHRERACPHWYAFPVFVLGILAGAGAFGLALSVWKLYGNSIVLPAAWEWSAHVAAVIFLLALVCAAMAIRQQRRRARLLRERLSNLEEKP